jgi:nucleotide-binding universal stress UspA family protein
MKVVIAYDGSTGADTAIEDLRHAGLPDSSEILIVCVAEGGLQAPESIGMVQTDFSGSWKDKLADAKRLCEGAGDRLRSMFPKWTIDSEALWGSPANLILEASRKWHADLIVTGSHGHSAVARMILGSVSTDLVHHSECSVRVARRSVPFAQGPLQVILGIDGSRESDKVLQAVAQRTWPAKTEVRIVSVVATLVPEIGPLEASTYGQDPAFEVIRDFDARRKAHLTDAALKAADYLRKMDLLADTTVLNGDPRELIPQEADRLNATMIFLGARGLGRMERLLLGSVSTHVLNHARCTVEVVR